MDRILNMSLNFLILLIVILKINEKDILDIAILMRPVGLFQPVHGAGSPLFRNCGTFLQGSCFPCTHY